MTTDLQKKTPMQHIITKKIANLLLLSLSILFTNQVLLASDEVPDSVELAALKNLYEQTNGSEWTNATGWPDLTNWPTSATSADFGSWYGITVNNVLPGFTATDRLKEIIENKITNHFIHSSMGIFPLSFECKISNQIIQ